MILSVKQCIEHLEKKYRSMTSLYILAHNLAKRLPKNEDVTLHFHQKDFP